MEHQLIVFIFLVFLAYVGYKSIFDRGDESSSDGGGNATAATGEPDANLEFERFVTITADNPEDLARKINRSLYFERRLSSRVIGTPQISADGRTAQVPIYRRI